MATELGIRRYVGEDLGNILGQAHLDAREEAGGKTGKVFTRVEVLGTGEDEKGNIRMWAEISLHVED